MLVDSHAHIYSEYYDDISLVISESKKNGINYIINSGVDLKSNKELLAIAKDYDEIFVTLGIHPENVNEYVEDDLKYIKEHINDPKVIAVGEIGLDYHYDGYSKENQITLFEKQLNLAEKYNLPVVIHSREATLDTLSIIKKHNVKGVIHSFSGSEEIAREYLKLGFVLGINGVVTFKNAKIEEVVQKVGINNFILETDSPYLTPEPLRGQKNCPGNVKYILDYLSEYLGISIDKISALTTDNVIKTFDKIKI